MPIIRLILAIQQEEFAVPITLADQPDLENIPAVYQQGKGNFWVALDQKKVAGTVALFDIGIQQACLKKMFVAAEYRGKELGTAQKLLETALQWAKERSVREVYLGTTEQFKAAHQFYARNGFVEISRDQLPPAFPVVRVDTRFFQRIL